MTAPLGLLMGLLIGLLILKIGIVNEIYGSVKMVVSVQGFLALWINLTSDWVLKIGDLEFRD